MTFRSVDLDHVAALPDLRHLDIVNAHGVTFSRALGQVAHLELRDTRLDALPDAPELEHLEIHGGRLPRLDVSRYPKLKHLIVQGVDELRGIDGVAGLELVTVRLAGLAASPDLSGMASLKTIDLSVPAGARVRLAGTNPSELSLAIDAGDPLPDMQGTGLKSLTLSGSSATDLSALAGVGHVASLSLIDMPQLESMDGLVEFSQLHARALPNLKRVRGGARLARFSMQNCPALPDLDGLGACPKLTRLDVWNCPALVSLSGLSRAPLLTSIHASNCTALKSVEGLGACAELSDLQFVGCKGSGLDLMPLAGNTKIQRIRCTRTSIGKTRIPESLHPVVVPKSLVKSRSRSASDKPLPKQASGVARKQVAKLKKLIFSRDLDRMDQCADLVGALDSDEVATGLAGGSRLERGVETAKLLPRGVSPPSSFDATYDRLVPNRYFECGDQLMPYRGHGLRALAARVPDDSSVAGLRQAEGIVLVGRSKRYEKVPVRVWPLASFEQLKRAAVFCASEVQDPEMLGDCEALEELTLFDCDGVETLGTFTEAPALKTLRVERLGGAWTLGTEAGLARLEHLQVLAWWRNGWAIQDHEIRSLRNLRTLFVSGSELTEGAARMLARLPHLAGLTLLAHRENDFSRLAGLTRLKHLFIDGSTASGLAALPVLEGLESLTIRGVHNESLDTLTDQSVASVSLEGCGNLTGWEGLSGVEHLLLRGHRWRTSKELDGLGWDGLKTLRYSGKILPANVVNRLRESGVDVAEI